MAVGKLRNHRHLVVAQAALVWGEYSAEDLAEFIRCGVLAKGKAAKMPYDPLVADFSAQITANGGQLDFATLTMTAGDGSRVAAFPN